MVVDNDDYDDRTCPGLVILVLTVFFFVFQVLRCISVYFQWRNVYSNSILFV